ncbi:MAG: hypothetical protein IPL61_27760 [Myxococcales bacterium]|nr:hypothetical protein [Myxococcales bacterium]
MSELTSRTAVRRAALLTPDGERLALQPALAQAHLLAPLAPAAAIERLMAYLLDPKGRAILGADDDLAAWLAGSPLLRPCGPGVGVPIHDDLAAVIVAPVLAKADGLPPVLARWRWSPRADALIAATVASLEPDAGARALAALREPGPDEEVVHQALLQAGRALAWAPHLHDTPDGEAVIGQLVRLLDRGSPRPLLAQLVGALGPIARCGTAQGERVRMHAQAQLGAAVTRIQAASQPAGFAAELAAIDQSAGREDIERMKLRPDWEHAEYAAHVLGAAAPSVVEGFTAWHAMAQRLWGELPLMPAFIDGLVQSANTVPIAELVIAMAAGDEDDRALAAELACQLPVDDAAVALAALIEDSRAEVRVSSIRALALLGAIEPIMARLDDPAPEVAAAAALALVDLGQRDRVRTRRPDDPNLARRAAVAAATGASDTQTLGELAVALLHLLDDVEDHDELSGSPLLDALAAAVFTTPLGLERAAALVTGIPETLPLLALALPRDVDQQPGVLAPPAPRAALEAALADALTSDDEGAAIALGLLAGMACGDEALAARIAAALEATDGYAGQLLVALAEVRARTDAGAAAIAPLLAAAAPLLGRIYAGAAAGRILPVEHPAWAEVRSLLELGTSARAGAWASLRDRVRLE